MAESISSVQTSFISSYSAWSAVSGNTDSNRAARLSSVMSSRTRLGSVSDSRINTSLDGAEDICRRVVEAITDTGDYAVDFIHAYGNNGRRPYLKLVYKRMLDGMPVTAYNDLALLFDNEGIEKVSGSLFSVKDTGLEGKTFFPNQFPCDCINAEYLLALEISSIPILPKQEPPDTLSVIMRNMARH